MTAVELVVELASLGPYPYTLIPAPVLRDQAYMTAVELLVELASLQTAFLTLDEAIKTTNRRVNALDNVVIPKLENTIAYIKARPSARTQAAAAHGTGKVVHDALLGAQSLCCADRALVRITCACSGQQVRSEPRLRAAAVLWEGGPSWKSPKGGCGG